MSFLKSQHLRWLRFARTTITLLSLALSLTHAPTMAAAPADELPVANFTPYNDVPAFVRERLSEDIKSLVRDKHLTVLVLAEAYPSRKACVAMVGLSHQASKGLNPRLPAHQFYAHSFDSEASDWQGSQCVGNRLQVAIESLNEATPEQLMIDLQRTDEGGEKVVEPANSDKVQLSSNGLTNAAKDAVLNMLHAEKVQAAFDHRQVQTSVLATSSAFKSGAIMCTVHAGMGARTPEGRNMRLPAQSLSMVRLQTGGTPEGCIELLAPQTVGELLKQPWSAKGLLADFQRTREAGVPLPDVKAVAARRAAVLKQVAAAEHSKKTTMAQTASRNVLSCRNLCENGACVRIFPDGRKERWQAPRVFNLMTQNWEWNTTTNACGG